jgi:hypothetical protein
LSNGGDEAQGFRKIRLVVEDVQSTDVMTIHLDYSSCRKEEVR